MGHRERHRSERIGWLRAAVLGLRQSIEDGDAAEFVDRARPRALGGWRGPLNGKCLEWWVDRSASDASPRGPDRNSRRNSGFRARATAYACGVHLACWTS